jgi:RNA polymerase sigma-70 factor, ECF subfamily
LLKSLNCVIKKIIQNDKSEKQSSYCICSVRSNCGSSRQIFDKISTFKSTSSFKTWVFTIATNLAYDSIKKRNRWSADAQDKSKAFAISNESIGRAFHIVNNAGGENTYDLKEHIDFCFTCIAKSLPIENQIALILKDVYDFSVNDICLILEKTEGIIKHLLIDARKTMTEIFDQ